MRTLVGLILAGLPLAAQVQLKPVGETSRLLVPGEAVTLAVEARDGDGTALIGYAVVFARAGDPAILEKVATNDAGVAEYSFTAPEAPGPLPVEVLAEKENISTVFALNVLAGDQPAVGAAQARGRLPEEPVQGPYLLPAGAVLRLAPGRPSRIFDSPVWLAWRDSDPFQVFEHPVQIHLVDTVDPEKPVEMIDTNWWPSVRLAPGQRFVSLRGWRESRIDPETEAIYFGPVASALARASGISNIRQIITKELNACAVIVYGSSEYWQRVDVSRAKQFFETEKGLAPGNVITNTDADGNPQPVTSKRFQELMTAALEKGCTRLYLVVIGHGVLGSVTFTRDGSVTGDNEQDLIPYDYERMANLAKQFTGKGIPVTTIIKSCQSGSAIPSFHQAGILGEIYTSSNSARGSYYSWWNGSIFMKEFFSGWASESADYDGNGAVDPAEAFQYSLSNSNNAAANPQASRLGPIVDLAIPNVWIDLKIPSTNPGFVVVTKPDLVFGDYEVVITLQDASIAAFANDAPSITVSVPAGQSQVRIPVTGKKDGVTIARARINDSQRKLWRGTSQVTVGAYEVSSSQIGLKVGETGEFAVRRHAEPASQLSAFTLKAIALNLHSVDTATISPAVFAAGSPQALFRVTGTAPGEGTYRFSDGTDSFQFSVLVDGYTTESPYGEAAKKALFEVRRRGRLALNLSKERVQFTSPGSAVYKLSDPLPSVNFPEGSLSASAEFGCPATQGVAELIAKDNAGNENPITIYCTAPVSDIRNFAAAAPFAYLQALDWMAADVGARDATGQLSPNAEVSYSLPPGIVALALDPDKDRLEDVQPLFDQEIEKHLRASVGNFASIDGPGTTRVLRTNRRGFLRIYLVALKEGTYNIGFKVGSLPAIQYPVRAVTRLAPLPDEMVLFPVASPIRVGQEVTITTQINRTQRPLQDAIVTLQSRNGNVRFLDGTVTTSGTTTQQRTNSLGRSVIRFRVLTAGPIDIGIFSGRLLKEIKTTAAP